jgi:predicted MPP superfamily phosphohydrolase
LKAWPVLGIAFLQAVLLLGHWFIYRTWIVFQGNLGPEPALALWDVLFLMAFSFIVASLLSFRFSNLLVDTFYKIAAVWMGFLNFFAMASVLCWVTWLLFRISGLHLDPALLRPKIADVFFTLAVLDGLYGLINARRIRVRSIPIHLPNLPSAWRGRTALLLSDLHLGPVNGLAFSRRIVNLANSLKPDIVLLPGDLFDGTKVDADRLAAPFKQLTPPLGVYYSTGNHDEFGGAAQYAAAIAHAGIHVLTNEKVVIDGLQVLGVPYHDSTYPIRMKATVDALQLSADLPSILLSHVPNRLPIVEQAGVNLQLSGHTHGGQIVPSTWFVRLAFGKFTYGLNNFRTLQVYTSSGVGTWGPPMRVRTHPEVVLLQFE